jgi:hypothetical protein
MTERLSTKPSRLMFWRLFIHHAKWLRDNFCYQPISLPISKQPPTRDYKRERDFTTVEQLA